MHSGALELFSYFNIEFQALVLLRILVRCIQLDILGYLTAEFAIDLDNEEVDS